jgi:hypothetical protein
MNSTRTGLAGWLAARSERRSETAERRRIEQELSSFVSESEKAELSAILERNAEEQGVEIHDLISQHVLAVTEHRAA